MWVVDHKVCCLFEVSYSSGTELRNKRVVGQSAVGVVATSGTSGRSRFSSFLPNFQLWWNKIRTLEKHNKIKTRLKSTLEGKISIALKLVVLVAYLIALDCTNNWVANLIH